MLDVGRDDNHPRGAVHLGQLLQHIQAVHALHHQIQQNEVRLLEKITLERDQPVLGFGDGVTGRLQDLAGAAPRQRRVVDEQDFARAHIRAITASAMRSTVKSPSLSPASTTERGMP